MTEYIVGATSRIARAYCEKGPTRAQVHLNRAEYLPWVEDQSVRLLEKTFAKANPNDVIHVFAAVTDPKASVHTIEKINIILPELIYNFAAKAGTTVFTYGTALEAHAEINNPYIESKRRLVRTQSEYLNKAQNRLVHLRLHTVFGVGRPQAHMFLGQILNALENDSEFLMSSGRQLREYQPAEWVANQISAAIEKSGSGVLEITHGVQMSLAQLAYGVFSNFDKEELLRIGALSDPEHETYPEESFEPSAKSTDAVLSLINQVCLYLRKNIRANA